MTGHATGLLGWGARALAELGGEVRRFAGAENCVRRREPREACTFAGLPAAAGDANPARLPFVVEVEGLPNLMHELAHAALLGRLQADHATEYSRIPFDLATAHGRRLLFEELACCVASCAWHPGDDAAAQAWFAEQVAIQPLFFGFERDPAGFLAAADRQLRANGDELESTIGRALAGVEGALAAAGAPPAAARPRRPISFDVLWRRLPGRASTG